MSRTRPRVFLMTFALTIAMLALGLGVQSGQALAGEVPTASSNAWANGYSWGRYGQTSKSALDADESGGLQRVEYSKDAGLVVEDYTAEGLLTSRKVVDSASYHPSDLADASKLLWGGVFCGQKYNFVVTGQDNLKQDNGLAVVRVTRYTKQWALSGSVECKNINTYIPFAAGSCAMAEHNGTLMIRTCHEMYQSSDGKHHQASMAFVFEESTLRPLGHMSNVMNIRQTPLGYVSHSFDQKLALLKGTFYSIDLGDAYPRSVVLKKLGYTGDSSYVPVKSIKGSVGDNDTYTTIGGLAASEPANTLLAIGTQRDQNALYSNSAKYTDYPRNVWLSVVNADNMTVRELALTSYVKGSVQDAENAQIVKVADNEFLVMWGVRSGDEHSRIDYEFIDGSGKVLKPVQSFAGALSDCQPIVTGGKVIWYATGASRVPSGPVFYSVDLSKRAASVIGGTGAIADGMLTVPKDSGLIYTGKALTPKVTVRFGPLELVEGTDYTVSYEHNVQPGRATVTVTGKGRYEGSAQTSFYIDVAEADDKAVANFSDLIWYLPTEVTDKYGREEVAEAQAAYDKLTEAQKGLISKDDMDTFNAVLKSAAKYDAKLASKPKPGGANATAAVVKVDAKTVTASLVVQAAKKAGASLSKVKTVVLDTKVRTLKRGVFRGCGATTLVVQTKKLKAKSVKGSLAGSKVKTVKVELGTKSLNKKYTKSYAKAFAKKNSGKSVAVQAA